AAKLRANVLDHGRRAEIDAANETPVGAASRRGEERLLVDERRRRADAWDRRDPRDDHARVREPGAARLVDEQVRVGGDDPVADPVLEARHHREHDDEGRHAEEDPADADPHEQRQVRPLAAGAKVAQAEKQLEGKPAPHEASPTPARPASGLRCGNRMTSRIDGWLAKSITRRSMPIPSPAAGGIPSSSARTWSSTSQCASSSPRARSWACSRKRASWSIG